MSWYKLLCMTSAINSAALCLELIHEDTHDGIIEILDKHGLWDNPEAWRSLGDNDGNIGIVANQQSSPVNALAEKITNSIDARLIRGQQDAQASTGFFNKDRNKVTTLSASTPAEAADKFILGRDTTQGKGRGLYTIAP